MPRLVMVVNRDEIVLKVASAEMNKTLDHGYLREGRVIRRLVSLVDPVTNLIAEYDRRVNLAGDNEEIEFVTSSEAEDRIFHSYKELIRWCPSVEELMKTTQPAKGRKRATTWQDLQKGADRARADDTNTLKSSVATWLNEQRPHLVPPFSVTEKRGRGFGHEVTGRLLSPVDYSWSNPVVRRAIQDRNPHYAVTAYMWPRFLYRKGRYDRLHPSKDLFKGELLVRAFRCIFTSPSSACEDPTASSDSDDDQPRPSRADHRVHTRCNVARLSNMQTVEPRAIAYIAVQLRFALSNRTSWDLKDDNFNYRLFYNNIVDWFECPQSEAKAEEIKDLLIWWNATIFDPRRSPTPQLQEPVENLSVAMSME
ncbi:hypothetical protein L210DRAFT_3528291 [Boletus edulis BED1]|uniref:Uncharacterized protein n=1 Tax=Boletus edulis BED1 TaxID=1328754 RepID=A0AAD4GHN3_BOLED|nr:hypothetical protein L210DRAFT_3528291 [Boletus edulis BED1]